MHVYIPNEWVFYFHKRRVKSKREKIARTSRCLFFMLINANQIENAACVVVMGGMRRSLMCVLCVSSKHKIDLFIEYASNTPTRKQFNEIVSYVINGLSFNTSLSATYFSFHFFKTFNRFAIVFAHFRHQLRSFFKSKIGTHAYYTHAIIHIRTQICAGKLERERERENSVFSAARTNLPFKNWVSFGKRKKCAAFLTI